MLTVAQAASLLNVHPSLVRRWISQGRIKATAVTTRMYLIDEQDLSAFQLTRKPAGRPKKEQSK